MLSRLERGRNGGDFVDESFVFLFFVLFLVVSYIKKEIKSGMKMKQKFRKQKSNENFFARGLHEAKQKMAN